MQASSAMAEPQESEKSSKGEAKIYALHFRICLGPFTIHFKSDRYMKRQTMYKLDMQICKKTLKRTAQMLEVR